MSQDKAKNIAKLVYKKFGLDIPVSFEWLEKLPLSLKYELIPLNADGILFGHEIIINLSKPLVRQRFTIAHELGHFFIPEHGGFFSCENYSEENELEKEADAFAAELLMPDEKIKQIIESTYDLSKCIPETAEKFNVSHDAAMRSLLNNTNKCMVMAVEDIKNKINFWTNHSFDWVFQDNMENIELLNCFSISKHENEYNGRKIIVWDLGEKNFYDFVKQFDMSNFSKSLNSALDSGLSILPIIPILYEQLNKKVIFTISYRGAVLKAYKKILTGRYVMNETDESYEKVFRPIEEIFDAEFTFRSYLDDYKHEYQGKMHSGDSKAFLNTFLTKYDKLDLRCRINGIIGSANSMFKDKGILGNRARYYNVLKNRFEGRFEEIMDSEFLREFDDFLWLKAMELDFKWNK